MERLFKLQGEVSGKIWMPSCELYTKEFREIFSRTKESHCIPKINNLREVLLKVTNDGDFQSCSIDWALLEVEDISDDGRRRKIRVFELKGNDKNKDLWDK